MNMEIKEHPEFVGYGVSKDGRVWSRRPLNGVGPLSSEWREITPSPVRGGYLAFKACDGNGGIKTALVHAATLEAFIGPRPDGFHACHNNGVRTDNRIENLRWGTPKSNYADRDSHGTTARGERNGKAKLTAAKVLEIRAKYAAGGVSQRALAIEYGVSQLPIEQIIKRKLWKHIPPQEISK